MTPAQHCREHAQTRSSDRALRIQVHESHVSSLAGNHKAYRVPGLMRHKLGV
jgi:hypothetical protein